VWQQELTQGIADRDRGEITQSIYHLRTAAKKARPHTARWVTALTQLGVSLTAAGRLSEAEEREKYQAVVSEAAADPVAFGALMDAQLNLLRLKDRAGQFEALEQLYPDVARIADAASRGRAYLSLACQVAMDLLPTELGVERVAVDVGATGVSPPHGGASRMLALTYLSPNAATAAVQSAKDDRLELESQDALVQLYEVDGRPAEGLQLERRALRHLDELPSGQLEDRGRQRVPPGFFCFLGAVERRHGHLQRCESWFQRRSWQCVDHDSLRRNGAAEERRHDQCGRARSQRVCPGPCPSRPGICSS
jgi:hypothetical protein